MNTIKGLILMAIAIITINFGINIDKFDSAIFILAMALIIFIAGLAYVYEGIKPAIKKSNK